MLSQRAVAASQCQADDSTSSEEDALLEDFEPLTADVYCVAISMMLRDIVWLHEGTSLPFERAARIVNSMLLIVGTGAFQTFLLFAVLGFAEKHVGQIRKLYGEYEARMYPNHTELTVNGYPRGLRGYRQDELFLTFEEDTLADVCEVPLSHPGYLAAVLFVWGCTCLVELRCIVELWYRLVVVTPTVKSVDAMLQGGSEEHSSYVKGLTLALKAAITVFVQLPRLVTLLLLLWLGCRWLTATVGLEDVLLNGLALEFMLVLKGLFYNICTSHRNQLATERLFVRPFREKNSASCITFFDSQIWGLICIGWVVFYIFYFQSVLPSYRWDVADLCERYHVSTQTVVAGKQGHAHHR